MKADLPHKTTPIIPHTPHYAASQPPLWPFRVTGFLVKCQEAHCDDVAGAACSSKTSGGASAAFEPWNPSECPLSSATQGKRIEKGTRRPEPNDSLLGNDLLPSEDYEVTI